MNQSWLEFKTNIFIFFLLQFGNLLQNDTLHSQPQDTVESTSLLISICQIVLFSATYISKGFYD